MDLVARASVVIRAPRRAVWSALLAPATIPEILPVSEVVQGWRLGEPFVWVFSLGDIESRVEGRVVAVVEERLLEYEYVDPHARVVQGTHNVHRVTIELSDDDLATRVSVVQDANLSLEAQAHAEGGWRLALNNLRTLVEKNW